MPPLNKKSSRLFILLPSLMCRYSSTQATCALHDVGGLLTQRLPSAADDEKYGLLVSPDAAVQACMLGAVFASQRLRMFSAAIVQQCMGHVFLQRATSPSQAHNEEPQTHAKTAVDEATSQATAASPTLQHAQMRTSTSATAAAEPAPASAPQLNDVLGRQQGFKPCSGSPPACSAAPALTMDGKQRAQDSISMLKETVDELGSTLQSAQVWCHACCRKKTPKDWSTQWHQSCHDVLHT